MTKVMACTCVSSYQDAKYGNGNRVHNETAVKNGGWRCTVCGKDKS